MSNDGNWLVCLERLYLHESIETLEPLEEREAGRERERKREKQKEPL